jgi:zinc transport system substrate-binding protein
MRSGKIPPHRSVKAAVVRALLAGLAAAVTACAAPQAAEQSVSEDVIRVWVSIVPQEYFVERIGGDKVQVEVMVPPGFNPAIYEPKPTQIEGLADADMYVQIRVPFEEAWLTRILTANEDVLLVDQSQGIDRIEGKDPHIWLSPRLAKVQARTIYDGLARLDGSNEGFYRANLDAFLADLEKLDVSIEETLSGVETRRFLVFHPAWSYFARDYGLEMIPVQIEGSEPSAADMAHLIETARADNIRIIFAQPEFSTQSAETIAREIGGQVLLISPLAPDWMLNLQRVADTFAEVLAEGGKEP